MQNEWDNKYVQGNKYRKQICYVAIYPIEHTLDASQTNFLGLSPIMHKYSIMHSRHHILQIGNQCS
jgi:hypothetical protein